MVLYQLFKDKFDNDPKIRLPIEKKIRVLDVMDEGLSKYMPKKPKMNFPILIQMIEKMLDDEEKNPESEQGHGGNEVSATA